MILCIDTDWSAHLVKRSNSETRYASRTTNNGSRRSGMSAVAVEALMSNWAGPMRFVFDS